MFRSTKPIINLYKLIEAALHIPYHILQAVTDFGDSQVLSLATISATAVLYFEGEKRAALRFFLTMLCTAAVIGIFKMIFLGCGNAFTDRLHIYSPSGHASMTTAFCIATATHLATSRSRRSRIVIWLFAAVIALCIAASRVLLGYHTKPEIVIGLLVGSITGWLVWRFVSVPYEKKTSNPKHLAYFLAAIAVIAILAHGHHFPAEKIIRFLAGEAHTYIPACRPDM
jgi:membrane-associated phospholipid phosphatase